MNWAASASLLSHAAAVTVAPAALSSDARSMKQRYKPFGSYQEVGLCDVTGALSDYDAAFWLDFGLFGS